MSGLNEKSRDPSMEDVLASIRKIIAEELDAAHHAVVEEIGPSDQNLPWADEQQPKVQARKTPPVLPMHSALVPAELQPDPAISEQDLPDAETKSSDLNGSLLVSDTVLTEEHRAAVAEFEQVVSTLPAHDTNTDHDLREDIQVPEQDELVEAASSEQKSELAITPEALDEVSPITNWKYSPFPFEVTTVADVNSSLEEIVPNRVPDAPVISESSGSTGKLPSLAYSDFLDAQKPQVNVKLDLSFLQQKFNEPSSEPVVQKDPVAHEPLPVLDPAGPHAPAASADLSIFSSDHHKATLPPFIPANEPSYAPLVSQRTTEALLSSLRQLTEATRPQAPPMPEREQTLSPRLDEFMADVLRPLLAQWLDSNLERIVDQAVREEIAKFTRSLRP